MNIAILVLLSIFSQLAYSSCTIEERYKILSECINPVCVNIVNNATRAISNIETIKKLYVTRWLSDQKMSKTKIAPIPQGKMQSFWACPNEKITTLFYDIKDVDNGNKCYHNHCGIFRVEKTTDEVENFITVSAKMIAEELAPDCHFFGKAIYTNNGVNMIGAYENIESNFSACTPTSHPKYPESLKSINNKINLNLKKR